MRSPVNTTDAQVSARRMILGRGDERTRKHHFGEPSPQGKVGDDVATPWSTSLAFTVICALAFALSACGQSHWQIHARRRPWYVPPSSGGNACVTLVHRNRSRPRAERSGVSAFRQVSQRFHRCRPNRYARPAADAHRSVDLKLAVIAQDEVVAAARPRAADSRR